MNLVVECLEPGHGNCERLTDVGVPDLIQNVLDHVHRYSGALIRLACRASATLFVNPVNDYIRQAKCVNLLSRLISLGNAPDFVLESEAPNGSYYNLGSEARNALVGFFAQATPEQICILLDGDHLKLLVDLILYDDKIVAFDGLKWLFAVVSATRAVRRHRLDELQRRMRELNVASACERLVQHHGTNPLARGLRNFVLGTSL